MIEKVPSLDLVLYIISGVESPRSSRHVDFNLDENTDPTTSLGGIPGVRKSRFAALASKINSWDDDMSSPR